MEIKNKKNEPYLKWIILLCVVNFVVRLFFLNLPANFDEIGYFDGVRVIYENNFNPIVNFIGYKPPAVLEPVVLLWKLFGPSMVWGKLFIFFMSSVALFYTYLLGKKIGDGRMGLIAALILGFFPLFITQSFLYQDPVPLTAFLVMTMFYFLEKNYLAYFLSATLLVLTKETTVLIPMAFFLFSCYQGDFNFKKIIKSGVFLLPLMCFVVWMLLNKLFLGWYLLPLHAGGFQWRNMFTQGFMDFFVRVCVDNFVWLVISIVLAGFLYINKTKEKIYRSALGIYVLFTIIPVFYFLLMSSYLASSRYMLFTYPLIFILASNFIFLFLKEKAVWIWTGILILLMIISNVFILLCSPWFDDGDRDLRLFSNIYLNKETVKYVENNYKDPLIITTWPLDEFFANPFFGYSKQKHDFLTLHCNLPTQSNLASLKKTALGRDILFINPRNICGTGPMEPGESMDWVKTVGLKTYGNDHFPVEIFKLKTD